MDRLLRPIAGFFSSFPFRVILLILLICVPLIICITHVQKAVDTSVVPFANTTENIHAGLVNDDHINPGTEIGFVDYVWGSTHLFPMQIHKSFYFKFDRVGGYPGNDSFPLYFEKDWFLTYHPDWLVYLCDRTTLAYEFGDPNVPLDISNPQVLQFMLENWIYPALDIGYDGIGFDNVNLSNPYSRCGVWKTNSSGERIWTYLYGGEDTIQGPKYVASVLNWARFMYNAIHTHKPGATMEMNFSPLNGGVPSKGLAFNEQLLPYTDLDIDESGLTNAASHPPMTTGSNWQLEADFARDLASQGRGQLFITAYPEPNLQSITRDEKQWTVSNYLLLKGAHTYVFISSRPDQQGRSYGRLNLIPEYSAKVGYAVNAAYNSQGVYMRDYSNGKTIVNPSSSESFTISLPPNTYRDLYGHPLNGPLTLQPHSGIVLLKLTSAF